MKRYKRKFEDIKLGSEDYFLTHKAKKYPNGETWMLETTMNTMMSYANKNGIAIMSAFRGDYILKDNMKRHEILKQTLKKKGVKNITVDGYFIENEGTSNEKHVSEISVAVPFFEKDWIGDLYESKLSKKELAYYKGLKIIEARETSRLSFGPTADMSPFDKFSHFLLKIAGIFDQDCILIAHPELGVYLHYRTGKKEKIGTVATKDKIATAYTKLRSGKDKGRTFVFEGTRSPHNHIDAYRLMAEKTIF